MKRRVTTASLAENAFTIATLCASALVACTSSSGTDRNGMGTGGMSGESGGGDLGTGGSSGASGGLASGGSGDSATGGTGGSNGDASNGGDTGGGASDASL